MKNNEVYYLKNETLTHELASKWVLDQSEFWKNEIDIKSGVSAEDIESSFLNRGRRSD